MTLSTVSVVVPISSVTYVPRIRNSIGSIRAQHYPQELVTVIVPYLTKGGTETLQPLLRVLWDCDATLVPHRYPSGHWRPSLSRNVGFRRAPGEVLACLDADATVHPLALVTAADCAKGGAPARVRTKMLKQGPRDPMFRDWTLEGFSRSQQSGRPAAGPGSLIVASEWDVHAVHGWDERYVGYGPADWDYVLRLERRACRQAVDVSDRFGYWCLHQAHGRFVHDETVIANRAIYGKRLEDSTFEANEVRWGGLASSCPIGVVIPCTDPALTAPLTNALRAIRGSTLSKDEVSIVVVATHPREQKFSPAFTRVAAACKAFDAALAFHGHGEGMFAPALTRNVGARLVGRCEWTVFLDADTLVHPRFFERVVRSREPAATASVRMLKIGPRNPQLARSLTEDDFERLSSGRRVAPGTGGCVAFRSEVLAKLRGYDERYVGYGFSDWDMSDRLVSAGLPVDTLTGVDALHQRHGEAGFRTKNMSRYDKSRQMWKKSKTLPARRNPMTWGGLP